MYLSITRARVVDATLYTLTHRIRRTVRSHMANLSNSALGFKIKKYKVKKHLFLFFCESKYPNLKYDEHRMTRTIFSHGDISV